MIDNNKVIIAKNAKQTSVQAAIKVLPKTGSLRRKVYEYVLRKGFQGATDQEMESALHIDGNTIRPTRISLVKDGFIIDTGLTRKNENGNECIVWVVTLEEMRLF